MTEYLDIYALGEMLGKSAETIRKKMRSDPRAVPPRMHIPGSKMLRWRRADLKVWLQEQQALGPTRCWPDSSKLRES